MSPLGIWLNTNLFRKTQKYMKKSNTRLSAYIQDNCNDIIWRKLKELRSIMSVHCKKGVNSPEEFLSKWDTFTTRLIWPDEIYDNLEKLINVFIRFPDIVIGESYMRELDNVERNLKITTKFSNSTLKNVLTPDAEKNTFSEEHAHIFIRFAMIPYFKEQPDKFGRYIKLLRDTNNLLKVSNDEKEKPEYFEEQRVSIEKIVSAYCRQHENRDSGEIEFEETDFYKMMKDLFEKLSDISTQSESKPEEKANQEIINKVKQTYWKQIFPDSSFFDLIYSLGISKDELDILIDDAAEDTLTAYHAYCSRFINEKPPSWDKCISYSGFYMEMLYFLYSRLWQQDSEILQVIAKRIRDNGYIQFGTFINENAIIMPTVFIKDKCIIENAEIGDNAYITNCEISDGVIIEADVILDMGHLVVKKDTYVKEGTILKGEFSLVIP